VTSSVKIPSIKLARTININNNINNNKNNNLACDLLSACEAPSSCALMSEEPPEEFDVTLETTAGSFTIRTVTSWAPPFATRFWRLSRLGYMNGASFYRVDRVDRNDARDAWVVQFGYRGSPAVDQCWDRLQTSKATWSVHPSGNVRGSVSFSMDAVNNTGGNPNCTSADYCAQGFSTNIFINYANNSRLDAHGFSVFGSVLESGMEVVDRLYAGYGEVADLCTARGASASAAGDRFCKGYGADCPGVNMSRLVTEGDSYIQKEQPLLDRITSTRTDSDVEWL